MDKLKFNAILPMIIAALTDKIANAYNLDQDTAIQKLYATELYGYLEIEETKVWQYSVEKIFSLYQSETETGKLELPEY